MKTSTAEAKNFQKCTSRLHKGKMINSILIANDFINALPKIETPQETKGYEGFFHVNHLTGSIEETILELIIRDHSKQNLRNVRT
jgi:di/tripeptidase